MNIFFGFLVAVVTILSILPIMIDHHVHHGDGIHGRKRHVNHRKLTVETIPFVV
jgi:hypothetical protein